jgi:hypothetical protein
MSSCCCCSLKFHIIISLLKVFMTRPKMYILLFVLETLLAGHNDSFAKDDDNSTDNGSSNGDQGLAASGIDPSSMLAAREKTLISHAMDTLTRKVAENGGSDASNESDEEMFDMEGALLDDNIIPFKLATPSPLPTHLNVHFICETASRLLFLSVHWVRSIPAFSQLK